MWSHILIFSFPCRHAKSVQSCLALCDPIGCSPPGSSVHGILQARILEWVTMPSSRGSSRPRDRTWVSWGSCIEGRFFYRWATRQALFFPWRITIWYNSPGFCHHKLSVIEELWYYSSFKGLCGLSNSIRPKSSADKTDSTASIPLPSLLSPSALIHLFGCLLLPLSLGSSHPGHAYEIQPFIFFCISTIALTIRHWHFIHHFYLFRISVF